MCTCRPALRDAPVSARGRRRAGGTESAVSCAMPSRRRGRPTTMSEISTSASCSSEPEHTSSAGTPSSAQRPRRLERLEVAEVVADEQHALAVVLLDRPPAPPRPCACRARGPRAPAGRARAAGRGGPRRRRAAAAAGRRPPAGRAAVGCGPRRRGPSPPRGRPRRPPPRAARAAVAERRQPRRGLGEANARERESQRSLPYCPMTISSASGRQLVRDVLEVAERDDLPGRAAGDHHDGAHLRGELGEHPRGVGVDDGRLRVLDDRREGAVEVEADDDAGGERDQVVVPVPGLVGAQLHGPSQPEPARDAAAVPVRSSRR